MQWAAISAASRAWSSKCRTRRCGSRRGIPDIGLLEHLVSEGGTEELRGVEVHGPAEEIGELPLQREESIVSYRDPSAVSFAR